jgi:hypothetical protein
MFFKNKRIKKNKILSTPLISVISNLSVMNQSLNSGNTNTPIRTSQSYTPSYISGSTMTIEGNWEMERERKRIERKGKIEELFPELISLLDND